MYSQEHFFFTYEGETDGHLGVEIKINDNKLMLKQSQLMKRTIELLGLMKANPRSVPVAKPLLSENSNGKDKN